MNSAPSRVPVFASFAAGWTFLFTRFHRLVLRLWLPLGLLYLLQINGLTPQALLASGQASQGALFMLFCLHLSVTIFVIASAYRVAFGEEHRFFLARLEVGPDEVRLLLAKLGLWLAVAVMLLSGTFLGQIIMQFLATLSFTIAADSSVFVKIAAAGHD